MKRIIKSKDNYISCAAKSDFKDDPEMQEIANEAAKLGVDTKVTYSNSGRGTAGTSGDGNIMFYVPEELYSKELRKSFLTYSADIIAGAN